MWSLVAPSPAAAITTNVELLVGIVGRSCPQVDCTAFGGPDASSNTPLDLAVAVGEQIDVFVNIDFGLPMREYQTSITLDVAGLSFVDAADVSTLGFSSLADPNTTLSDGTPGAGDANSNFCPPITCVAPSSNSLYRISFTIDPGFTPDVLRDLTVSVNSITFEDSAHDLDPNTDTASIRLTLIPEPGSGALLALGLLGLAGARRRDVR